MSDDVDRAIASLGDWRGAMLSRIRALIRDAVPEVVEAVKWRKSTNPLGVPTWSHHGILCTGESYRDTVKLTFPHGHALADPAGLFVAGATGVRRAIDIRAGDPIDEAALRALIRDAAARNAAAARS